MKRWIAIPTPRWVGPRWWNGIAGFGSLSATDAYSDSTNFGSPDNQSHTEPTTENCKQGQTGVEDKQRDLIDRLLFPRSQEDWEEAKAESDAAPREPGRYKIGVAGEPHRTEPSTHVCEDCGTTIRSKGGIRFGDDLPCKVPAHQGWDDCHMVHIHQVLDLPDIPACRAWKWRRYRLRWKLIGKQKNRYLSWKWKRRAKKERADPSRWAEFWKWNDR